MSSSMRFIALFGSILLAGCSAVNYSLPSSQRTAEDIGARIIRLAQNLHTLDDIRPESIERHTGLEVEFNHNNRLNYGFGCVFWLKLDTDSIRNWTRIPFETGHGFQRKLDT